MYRQKDPATLIRFVGQAPVEATVFEMERLRCNACQQVFTADEPETAGAAKYDETAVAMIALLAEHKTEPNSGLGKAISYLLNHWSKLTLFLRQAGAPLDNNISERSLKQAIRHRRASLFYRTKNGALVGDVYMALIVTTQLHHGDPLRYLTALFTNYKSVAAAPADWLPWNYEQTLARLHQRHASAA